MGGRGTFAAGNPVAYTFETVGMIEGVKVLKGINGKHGLPEEAHSSLAYIVLKPDGTFHEMRIYDKEHYLVKEIAYHPEPKLNGGNRTENVLHVHDYKRDNFKDRTPHRITRAEYETYKKYFKGVPIIDKW
jgi:hypothetical protein